MSEAPRPSLPVLLIVSLMANMLLVGLIAGSALARRDAPDPPSAHAQIRLPEGMQQSASPEDRRAVRRAFTRAWMAARPLRAEQRAARRAVGEAILAEPYDAAALETAFERLRAADVALDAAIQAELARQLETLTSEQRLALAISLRRLGEGAAARRGSEARPSNEPQPQP